MLDIIAACDMEIEDGLVRYQLQQTAEEHRDTLSELWAAHPFDLGPSCSDIALQSKVDASGSDLKPPNRCLNGHLSQAQGCRGLKSLLDDALLVGGLCAQQLANCPAT